jgi:hypothetical protein
MVLTAAWAVALVVLLVVRDRLAAADRWWVWVAVAGCGIGAFALFYVPRLKKSREHAVAQRAAHDDGSSTPPAGD